jgi:hypothetical protein
MTAGADWLDVGDATRPSSAASSVRPARHPASNTTKVTSSSHSIIDAPPA